MGAPPPRVGAVAAGVFLLALSVLAYEIALTRVFSVVLSYHYVFLVLSMAMAGLGGGALLEHYRSRRVRVTGRLETAASTWATLAAVTTSGSILAIDRLGVASGLLPLGLVTLLPFFFAGATLAGVFRRLAPHSSWLYAADLAGAALGSLFIVWALNRLGAPNAVLATGTVAALGAVLLSFERPVSRPSLAAAAVGLALTGILLTAGVLYSIAGDVPIGRDPNKDLYRLLNDPSIGGRIVETRWSAFGRTDLAQFEGDPDSMSLFVDGAAGSPMFRWDGRVGNPGGAVAALLSRFPGSFPFRFLDERQKDHALIIGPGGGRDVLVALLAGVKQVTAVEVNRDFVALARKYSNYNGGLYTSIDNVRLVVDEGRHFLRQSKDRYDIILLTLPVTKSSRSYQGYALTESFLFTRESFRDYLSHLTPEGNIVIVAHGFGEAVKLLTTALAALSEEGKDPLEAMRQIYLLGHPMFGILVVQNRPMDAVTAGRVHDGLHQAGFDGQSSYVPYTEQLAVDLGLRSGADATWLMMNQNLIDLARGRIRLQELVDAVPVDIGPATDDRPFFFNFEPGLPRTISALLWLSALFLGLVVGVPVARRRLGIQPDPDRALALPWPVPFVFAALGAGFMLVELALFQRLLLYLGHPTFALALLLSALLSGAGVGSVLSGMVRSTWLVRASAMSALVVAGAVLFLAAAVPRLFDPLVGSAVGSRIAVAGLLGGLGLVMGAPFPLSIRFLHDVGAEPAVAWLWGVNAAASVFGSVAAVAVAILFGYSVALALGGLAYVAVAAVTLVAWRRMDMAAFTVTRKERWS